MRKNGLLFKIIEDDLFEIYSKLDLPLSKSSLSVISCQEEEYGFCFEFPFRLSKGWSWLPIYFRGPGGPALFSSLFLGVVGIWRFKRKPRKLVDVDPELYLNRNVTEVCDHLGCYGMGGPGFFGLKLDNGIWLVFTLWGAVEWISVDNKLIREGRVKDEIEALEKRNELDLLISIDEFIGSKIKNVELSSDFLKLELIADGVSRNLLVTRDCEKVPNHRSGSERCFDKNEDVSDCLVLTERANLWT